MSEGVAAQKQTQTIFWGQMSFESKHGPETQRVGETRADTQRQEAGGKYLNKPQYKASKQTNQEKESFMLTAGYNLQCMLISDCASSFCWLSSFH